MPVTSDHKPATILKKGISVTRDKRGAKPDPMSIAGRARRLGVTKQHLHLVLRGDRQSARLLRRYQELLATEGASK